MEKFKKILSVIILAGAVISVLFFALGLIDHTVLAIPRDMKDVGMLLSKNFNLIFTSPLEMCTRFFCFPGVFFPPIGWSFLISLVVLVLAWIMRIRLKRAQSIIVPLGIIILVVIVVGVLCVLKSLSYQQTKVWNYDYESVPKVDLSF